MIRQRLRRPGRLHGRKKAGAFIPARYSVTAAFTLPLLRRVVVHLAGSLGAHGDFHLDNVGVYADFTVVIATVLAPNALCICAMTRPVGAPCSSLGECQTTHSSAV